MRTFLTVGLVLLAAGVGRAEDWVFEKRLADLERRVDALEGKAAAPKPAAASADPACADGSCAAAAKPRAAGVVYANGPTANAPVMLSAACVGGSCPRPATTVRYAPARRGWFRR